MKHNNHLILLKDVDTENNLNLAVFITRFQTDILRQYSTNESHSLIKETTDILSNMFRVVTFSKEEHNIDDLEKTFKTLLQDSRIQLMLLSAMIVS